MSQNNVAAQLLPYLQDRVTHGDCIAVLTELPSACVDIVVADPPYLVGYRERNGRPVGNDDNDAWLLPAFRAIARVMKAHCLCASFYGWPHPPPRSRTPLSTPPRRWILFTQMTPRFHRARSWNLSTTR